MSKNKNQPSAYVVPLATFRFGAENDILSNDASISYVVSRGELRTKALNAPCKYKLTITRRFGALDRMIFCVFFSGNMDPNVPDFKNYVDKFVSSFDQIKDLTQNGDNIRAVGVEISSDITDNDLLEIAKREFFIRSSAGNA